MGILLSLLLFILIAGTVFVFGYLHYVKPARLLDQLATSTSDAIPTPLTLAAKKPAGTFSVARLLEPIGTLIPVSPQDAANVKHELTAAGIRSSSAVTVLYGAKIVLAAVFLLGAVLFRNRFPETGVLRILAPVGCAGMGYALPSFVLGRLSRDGAKRYAFRFPTCWTCSWCAVRPVVGSTNPLSTSAASSRRFIRRLPTSSRW